MRPLTFILTAAAALAWAGSALALPENGYIVFKESRLGSLTEVRAAGTGQVVESGKSVRRTRSAEPCEDKSYVLSGPRWRAFEPYLVNVSSTPTRISASAALADLVAAAEAWESPFATECPAPGGTSTYTATYGGKTRLTASLAADLTADGENVVSFQSLAGTVCDGATACVVLVYEKKTIQEADLALEKDLTRYGYADYWTTDDTTWWDDKGGRWGVSDVATHEFGHFAGLDHVVSSPTLTMYPYVHDGDQTLGLGDMLGLLALY